MWFIKASSHELAGRILGYEIILHEEKFSDENQPLIVE